MQGYPTIIRTGSAELDVQTVEQHRRAAAAQGVTLHVEPLAGGGFQITAAHGGEAIGATLPSNNQPTPTPMRASAPHIAAAPQEAPLENPGGTLPSHFANFPYAKQASAPRVEVILSSGEGYCESCHRVGPLRQAHFMQNIGAIVLRFPRTVSGQLCKFCIDKFFFRFTAVTMLLGWWGIISFFYSLVAVPANIINWVGSIGMRPPPDDIESLRERRARGSVAIAIGALQSAFALLTLSLGALLATTREEGSSVVALAVTGATVGVIATVILFFGIRARIRASGALRRLGAIR